MTKKAYVLAFINVMDPEKYAPYVAGAPETIAVFGGRYLVRNGDKQILEGQPPADRLVVLEFPSAARAQAWYQSKAYQAQRLIRASASTGSLMIVEGLDTSR